MYFYGTSCIKRYAVQGYIFKTAIAKKHYREDFTFIVRCCIYNDTFPLLNVDIKGTIKKTAANTQELTNLGNVVKSLGYRRSYLVAILWTPYLLVFKDKSIEGKISKFELRLGGVIGFGLFRFFLFKRRVRKMYENILTTCYFYAARETDPENRDAIDGIIKAINFSKKKILMSKAEKRYEQVLLFATFVSGLLIPSAGITAMLVPTFKNLYPPIVTLIPGLNFILQNSYSNITFYIIIYFLMAPILLRYIYAYKWYNKLIAKNDIKKKEVDVYNYLVEIQRKILRTDFSEINGILNQKNIVTIGTSEKGHCYFGPSVVRVAKGISITWRNNDTNQHSLICPDRGVNLFNETLGSKKEFEYTFQQSGTFYCYCGLHDASDRCIVEVYDPYQHGIG